MSYSFEFNVPADPRAMRHVDERAVAALDAALGAGTGAEVMHGIDPRRILTFAAGGPPVWSVAVASRGDVHQFLTYGLSRQLDRSSPFDFELTMRVRQAGPSPMWPMLLLRSIARYHLSTGRQIAPGEFLDMAGPISQVPVAPAERASMPTTHLTTLFIVEGARVPTPAGEIPLRNVVGLAPAELELLESCRAATFAKTLASADPSLTVALDRPTLATNPAFRAAIEQAARSEGSDCKAVCIPGLAWRKEPDAFMISIPPSGAGKLARRIASRLPFGEGLIAHSNATGPGTEVLIVPEAELCVPNWDERRIVLGMPEHSPYLSFLREGQGAEWRLRTG